MFISDSHTKLLIDAGVSASKIATALEKIGVSPFDLDAVLVTHEHSDHICGLDVLTRKYGVPVYASCATANAITSGANSIEERFLNSVVPGESFSLRSAFVRPFRTPHDSVESVGYTITFEDKKFGIATDTGCVTKPMLSALAGCEAVVIESNHDVNMLNAGPYPYSLKRRILSDTGHLSNENCAWLATQLAIWGTKHIVLGHLSENNNTPEKAYDASCKMLMDNKFIPGKDVRLLVALRNDITDII